MIIFVILIFQKKWMAIFIQKFKWKDKPASEKNADKDVNL